MIWTNAVRLWSAAAFFGWTALLTGFVGLVSAATQMPAPKAPLLTAGEVAPAKREFRVFDATLYQRKPDLSVSGVRPLHIAYEPRLFTDSARATRALDAMPTDGLMRAQAEAARTSRSEYLVIDIESWSIYNSTNYPREAATSIARFTQVIEQARRIAPELKLGLFSPLPVNSGYDRLVAPQGSAADREMRHDNDNLLSLAARVDAIFPIGYTMTDDRQEWRFVVAKQVAEARRLNPDVPIYLFLWARYVDYGPIRAELKLRWIEREYWRYQLQAAYELADGIVLWGGWDPQHNRPQQWDAAAPWWAETADFLREKRISQ